MTLKEKAQRFVLNLKAKKESKVKKQYTIKEKVHLKALQAKELAGNAKEKVVEFAKDNPEVIYWGGVVAASIVAHIVLKAITPQPIAHMTVYDNGKVATWSKERGYEIRNVH